MSVDEVASGHGVLTADVMRHAARRMGSREKEKIVSEVRKADPLASERFEQTFHGVPVSQRAARTHNSGNTDARWLEGFKKGLVRQSHSLHAPPPHRAMSR